MSFGVQPQRRNTASRKLENAASPVLESLENRLLMATHTRLGGANQHAANYTDTFLTSTTGAASGITAAQVSHLYGLDQLNAANGNFPLYTNTGNNQVIVIVGAAAP